MPADALCPQSPPFQILPTRSAGQRWPSGLRRAGRAQDHRREHSTHSCHRCVVVPNVSPMTYLADDRLLEVGVVATGLAAPPGPTLTNIAFTNDMFSLGLPIIEKIARPIIVYVFLVVLLRIFGKRELAQLNPFDLVVLLSLSNTVQNAIIGEDNSVTGGLIGAFTLVAFNYTVVRFLLRHRRLDQLFEGRPTVLIDHGHIL